MKFSTAARYPRCVLAVNPAWSDRLSLSPQKNPLLPAARLEGPMAVVPSPISENFSRGRVKKLGAGLSLVFSTVPGRLQRAGGSGAVVEIPRSGKGRYMRVE